MSSGVIMSPTTIRDVLKDHINRTYKQDSGCQDWQKLPEIPSAAEILRPINQPQAKSFDDKSRREFFKDEYLDNLPHNVIDKPWDSVGDYIGAHYQLLREDAIAPLRQAVSIFKSQPTMKDNQDVSIYTHVHIIGLTFSNIGPAPRIEFSYEKAGKRIRWAQSKRLQQGTIVALTPVLDKFKNTCKVAVVAARPLQGVEQNPPQIDLFWGDWKEADFDPLQEYVMVEARSGYFEASRHMLVALQKLMTESFPLSDHLVYLQKSIGVPNFLEKQPMKNLNALKPKKEIDNGPFDGDNFHYEKDNSLNNVDILGPWPEVKDTTLDESQLTAIRRIMTKKLAIVQGPPGTGKTFLSISALSIMLDNLQPGDPPIIVAAQTNHALDQLLKLIAPVEPNFLRLGGRTSQDNIIIKERTLFKIRDKIHPSGGIFWNKQKNAKRGLETSSDQIQTDIQKALAQDDHEAKVLLELKILSQSQYDSLYDDDWVSAEDLDLPPGIIALWLGREQLALPPECPPTNMDFDDEEDLEFEALEEAEVEIKKKDDDDIDMLNGKWFPFRETYTGVSSLGYSDKRLQKILDSHCNLWAISPTIRGELYRYLRRQMKGKILEIFRNHNGEYHYSARQVKIANWEADADLIERSRIKLIGCTTTGLSKYRGLLASLQPRTMLIEEAAETLEGTILAAMLPSLQQLILVGDHQQLRAHCNVDTLDEAPFNLAVSMFERLVNNGIEYTMLNKQRRMISEFRELLDPFYPHLQDHESVLDRVHNRKPVPGMGGRDSYFFHHQWPESRDDFLSRFNVYEADMMTAFFTHIVLNGTEPSQITVLTYYNGQRKIILQKLRRIPELAQYGTKFNIFTVDSYQGEENDIVLLSLVRSNIDHKIGFLENKNRAVVALSRARRGLYIFGNSINLLAANEESFKLWSTFTDRLRSQNRLNIDFGLPIVCENHQIEIMIDEPGDWAQLAGGCRMKCDGRLPCGHMCIYLCHPFLHEDILCREACLKVLSCGHGCTERCEDVCRCACDTTMPPKIVASQQKDELWQPQLDDVLGDSSTNRRNSKKKILPDLSSACGSSPSDSAGSSPRKWREWDAGKADESLREVQAASVTSTTGPAGRFPVLVDNHREVSIKDGARVRTIKYVSIQNQSSISTGHNLTSYQPNRKAKGLTAVDLDGTSTADQSSNHETKFKYAGSMVDDGVPTLKLTIPCISPPSPILDEPSVTTAPGHLSKENVSEIYTMGDSLYLRGETCKDTSANIPQEEMVEGRLINKNFQHLTFENSTKHEEDLISFD